MKKKLALLLVLICFSNCEAQRPLISGYYGNYLEIVNSSGSVYGQFEYYDEWNESVKFFENVCKFYFFGTLKNDTIVIQVGLPCIELAKGKIVLHADSSLT